MIEIQHSGSLILIFNEAHFLDNALKLFEVQIKHFLGSQSLDNLLEVEPSKEQTSKYFSKPKTIKASRYKFKAGVHLNDIFAPLNTGLVQISRWHFKQSKNSMLKTRIYVIGCFVNFLVIFGYIWVEIVFLKELEKFKEIRKIEDLMKFKN